MPPTRTEGRSGRRRLTPPGRRLLATEPGRATEPRRPEPGLADRGARPEPGLRRRHTRLGGRLNRVEGRICARLPALRRRSET